MFWRIKKVERKKTWHQERAKISGLVKEQKTLTFSGSEHLAIISLFAEHVSISWIMHLLQCNIGNIKMSHVISKHKHFESIYIIKLGGKLMILQFNWNVIFNSVFVAINMPTVPVIVGTNDPSFIGQMQLSMYHLWPKNMIHAQNVTGQGTNVQLLRKNPIFHRVFLFQTFLVIPLRYKQTPHTDFRQCTDKQMTTPSDLPEFSVLNYFLSKTRKETKQFFEAIWKGTKVGASEYGWGHSHQDPPAKMSTVLCKN